MDDTERKIGSFIEVDAWGKIIASLSTQEVAAAAMIDAGIFPPGHFLVALAGDPETQWYDGDDVVLRPPNPAYADGMVIRDVPIPSYFFIDGERHLCADGLIEIDSDERFIRLVIQSFPNVDKVIEIENQEAT